ncbi:hypothetical protein J6590_002134 [Homalodisca vitripennis]|nr:hypothetical protein J6590_002134 [Homalodisca vitripennis]
MFIENENGKHPYSGSSSPRQVIVRCGVNPSQADSEVCAQHPLPNDPTKRTDVS